MFSEGFLRIENARGERPHLHPCRGNILKGSWDLVSNVISRL